MRAELKPLYERITRQIDQELAASNLNRRDADSVLNQIAERLRLEQRRLHALNKRQVSECHAS